MLPAGSRYTAIAPTGPLPETAIHVSLDGAKRYHTVCVENVHGNDSPPSGVASFTRTVAENGSAAGLMTTGLEKLSFGGGAARAMPVSSAIATNDPSEARAERSARRCAALSRCMCDLRSAGRVIHQRGGRRRG